MSRVLAVLAAALWCGACASTAPGFAATDTFITGVTVVDTVSGDLRRNTTIVVRGDEILAVEPAARTRVPSGATVIRSTGYAIPGLWDMHVHALSDADDAMALALPLFIANGVTGVRDMGSLVAGISETRRRIAADPAAPAPRLYVSGPLLDGVRLPWYGELPLILRTPEDVERELPRLRAAGVDFFKVYDQLPAPAYEAVVAWGRANNVPVAGHPVNGIGMLGAAEAGQRTIEHLSLSTLGECSNDRRGWFDRWINAKFRDGYDAYYRVTVEFEAAVDWARCEAMFSAMAARNVFMTPTLDMELNNRERLDPEALDFLPAQAREWCNTILAGVDQAGPEGRERAYATYNAALTRMRSAGVRILAGTDSPNNCLAPGFSLHWELALLQSSGMTPLEALQSATINAAAAMDRSADLGRIAPGYRADIVILEANPLEDIANTSRIEGVMAQGRWRDAGSLEALKQDARAATR